MIWAIPGSCFSPPCVSAPSVKENWISAILVRQTSFAYLRCFGLLLREGWSHVLVLAFPFPANMSFHLCAPGLANHFADSTALGAVCPPIDPGCCAKSQPGLQKLTNSMDLLSTVSLAAFWYIYHVDRLKINGFLHTGSKVNLAGLSLLLSAQFCLGPSWFCWAKPQQSVSGCCWSHAVPAQSVSPGGPRRAWNSGLYATLMPLPLI